MESDLHNDMRREYLRVMSKEFGPCPVMLYDQFGYPIYVPSSGRKIGDTIRIRRPAKFMDRG